MQTHTAVLVNEAITALEVKPGNWYLDATFGHGGHSQAIIDQGGKVIALDVDQAVIDRAHEKFAQNFETGNLVLIRDNFENLDTAVKTAQTQDNVKAISGVLFDFGTNSAQLKNQDRGFSFTGVGELDMRLDDRLGVKAKDLLALLSEKQLKDLFGNLGGEKQARAIAKAIAEQRKKKVITTNKELAELVVKIKKTQKGKLHPATKVFQALRIAVNNELEVIEKALPKAIELVENGGKVITISFHEGEDRIAKNVFKNAQIQGQGERQDLVTPTDKEISENPRARSAKMRVFTKRQ